MTVNTKQLKSYAFLGALATGALTLLAVLSDNKNTNIATDNSTSSNSVESHFDINTSINNSISDDTKLSSWKDSDGYNHFGYNHLGIDKAGYNQQYYMNYCADLYNRKEKAFAQLKNDEYAYALLDARVVMEDSLKLVILHKYGSEAVKSTFFENMVFCEKENMLNMDYDFWNRSHAARKLCNPNLHTLKVDSLTYSQVHFTIMQSKEILLAAEKILLVNQVTQ